VVRSLAIDVGSSSIRSAVISETGDVSHVHQERLSVRTPQPGEIELDAREIARLAIELAQRTLADAGPCDALGITNQRATTIVFDPRTGEPVGPALSWQDLRTVIDCLVLQGDGLRLAPNQSATKVRWLVQHSGRAARDLRFATIETWIAWHLSHGETFATDLSNAAVNGLVSPTLRDWDPHVLNVLALESVMLPILVDTTGAVGVATALESSPPITAMVGDQSASLFGQSCVRRGAKITFGTGAMLDVVQGETTPASLTRLDSGCYPVVARSRDGVITWATEGIMFSAGSCVEWLHDLGVLKSTTAAESLATSVDSSDGVAFVPAFSGLGTPAWDFGARGGFFGLTRGSSSAHLVRAVLEGIAQRGADLIEAAEKDLPGPIDEVRIDGGMSANHFLAQRLADFSGRTIAVSDELEATARGAGLMALVGAGHLSLEDVETLWSPVFTATPQISDDERATLREQWRRNIERVEGTIPELSGISF
jgi:glycerol kinase